MFQSSRKELIARSQHHIPQNRRSASIGKLYRPAFNRSSEYSPGFLSFKLLDFTDRLTLAELEHAIHARQADKAWALFFAFSQREDTIPLKLCTSLYALLKYAVSMLGCGAVKKNRNYQKSQVQGYVKRHHKITPKEFYSHVKPLDIPTHKELIRLMYFGDPEKAWSFFFKIHKEGKERISRTLCINLILSTMNVKTLNHNQLSYRLRIIALHGGASSFGNDILKIASADVLRLALISHYYLKRKHKKAHHMIDQYVEGLSKKKKKNRADSLDELVRFILKNKDLAKAQEVFDTVQQKLGSNVDINENVYINLMTAYRKQKNNLQAMKIFEQYLQNGGQPSLKGFNSILYLFALQKEHRRAAFAFSTMIDLNIEPDIATYTAMIRAYATSDEYEKCILFYEKMLKERLTPNVYIYSALIDASFRHNNNKDVLHWFQKMISSDTKPNKFIISRVLKSLSQHTNDKTLPIVRWITEEAFTAGVKPDVALYTTMLKIQAEQLGLENAMNIQKEMVAQSIEPNAYTYTTLISICGRKNLPETAQKIFDLMKQSEKHKPNTVTYTSLIKVWEDTENLEQAGELVLEFLKSCKIKQLIYRCLFC
ncbi:hypothetical protein BY458DRAFT_534829 [Sporodiniella umbellata]|nr:hypothetical protein BY458DRAFT_534829 [Sporodiniella umbellata]